MPKIKLTAKERKAGMDLRDVLGPLGPRVEKRVHKVVIPHNPLCGPSEIATGAYKKTAYTSTKPLRVWWIPQIPGSPFHVDVNSIEEANLVLDTLARYDLFQYENKIKPDYCNAGGLEEFTDGEWFEWSNEEGDQIDDLRRQARGA